MQNSGLDESQAGIKIAGEILITSDMQITPLYGRSEEELKNCSHEIKRCLLLGRKVMTNLDSILKSRDISSLTKVHIVKAMVFSVVMYGCENWTIKLNAKELMLLNCGVGEDT